MNVRINKKSIRDCIIFLRRLIPPEEKRNADQIICSKVLTQHIWSGSKTICLYMSTPEEVDTKPLLATAFTEGKIVVFPRVDEGHLVLHRVQSIKDFTAGAYQIMEPKKSTPIVDPKSVDLFIVPGIVFDRNGYRLGHGKGYYDKLLDGIDTPKIGLAYAVQIVAKLSHSSYDVPMTMVITEEKKIICQ